jgi:hypothetical protein
LASRKKNRFPPVVKELPQEWVRFRRVTCTEASKQVWVWTFNEKIATKYPVRQIRGGGPYGTHRSLDGTVVKS